MSKSTYYFEIGKKDVAAERNKDIMHEINEIFTSNKCRYGVRRVYHELLIIWSTGTSVRLPHCRSGRPMYLSSILPGVNATSHLSLI